jgi:sulfur relay (sulfurtransferase) DsrC/TusE family protein
MTLHEKLELKMRSIELEKEGFFEEAQNWKGRYRWRHTSRR